MDSFVHLVGMVWAAFVRSANAPASTVHTSSMTFRRHSWVPLVSNCNLWMFLSVPHGTPLHWVNYKYGGGGRRQSKNILYMGRKRTKMQLHLVTYARIIGLQVLYS